MWVIHYRWLEKNRAISTKDTELIGILKLFLCHLRLVRFVKTWFRKVTYYVTLGGLTLNVCKRTHRVVFLFYFLMLVGRFHGSESGIQVRD